MESSTVVIWHWTRQSKSHPGSVPHAHAAWRSMRMGLGFVEADEVLGNARCCRWRKVQPASQSQLCLGLPRATSMCSPSEALVSEQARVEPVRRVWLLPPRAPMAQHPTGRAHADALETQNTASFGPNKRDNINTWNLAVWFEVENIDVLCWDLAVRFEVAD